MSSVSPERVDDAQAAGLERRHRARQEAERNDHDHPDDEIARRQQELRQVRIRKDDLLFTIAVGKERELPIFGDPAYRSLENATALDSRTVSIQEGVSLSGTLRLPPRSYALAVFPSAGAPACAGP